MKDLKVKKPEILAPAGDMEALRSAIAGGADAVYFGLDIFNARIRAKNFTLENVGEATSLCHAHGVKAYVTLNTQLYNKELSTMLDHVGTLYEKGVDALIVADFGVAALIKKYYPDFEIHASTQASVHNLDGADLLCRTLGYSRVVLARELDRDSIEYISKNLEGETEIFVHGAHCMSVSGQCLASYCMGGRSGNRGECAQPCRLPYSIQGKQGYPLSLKDMSLSSHVNELTKTGASSFKIEGRMKNATYVNGVVSAWRKLIDQNRNATRAEINALGSLFSRGGFTDGYFIGKINASMLGIRSDKDKEETKYLEEKETVLNKAKISLYAKLTVGQPMCLTVKQGERQATVYGDIVERAQNAPMSCEDVKKNLVKLGNTPYEAEETVIEMDEGIIIRNSSINALRRQAISELEKTGREKKQIDLDIKKTEGRVDKIKTALFNNEEQIPKNSDYFDVCAVPLDRYKGNEAVNCVYMPPVILDKEWGEIKELLRLAKDKGVKYALASNIGQVSILKEMGFELIADFRFNIFNGYSLEYIKSLGFTHAIVSPELSLPQLRDFIGEGVIAYGKLPVMTTHKCVLQDTYGCEKCKGYIRDRQRAEMYAEGIYGHRNIIYNSVPIYMADRQSDIKGYSYHFIFSDESRDEAYKIIEAYKRELPTNKSIKRIK